MKSLALVVVLSLTAGASADDRGLGKIYDGSPAPETPVFEANRPNVPPPSPAVKRVPTVVPPELAAAKSRVGNDAQLARLGTSNETKSFTFGVIGDAEAGRFPWERVFSPGPHVFSDQMTALQSESPDFILQLGDFVSEGNPANYRDHVAWLDARNGPPLLRCIGNHDRSRPNGDADKNLYDAVFGPRDYFFDHNSWRFIALDSSVF